MKVFETVSFHITKPCNMKCKFCYATFEDMNIKRMSYFDALTVVTRLNYAGVEKITFAGGEPLLFPHLAEVIKFSKHLGLTTSIITNGSLLTYEWLEDLKDDLDWVGLSIDSLSNKTNKKIGRVSKNPVDYYKIIRMVKYFNMKLKINTVVNRFNQEESLQDFIEMVNPLRWKIFDTLRVEGQNDKQFEEIRTIDKGFERFIERHSHPSMVPEDNRLMTGSYLLIDPQGRPFENSKGKHAYSKKSLITSTLEECLKDISLNRETFLERGGLYNW